MNYTIKYMLYIIGCAAKGVTPDIPSEKLDYELMFKISKEQQVENLVYAALKSINADIPEELSRKFRQCYEKAIVREAKQALELENICAALSDAGIKHIPLKGSVVKYMYASPDLRQSGDTDILVDRFDEDEIMKIMTMLGYKHYSTNSKHSVYEKGKIHIELHYYLVDDAHGRQEFFSHVWETASQADGYMYEMQPEMLYAFQLTHLASHLSHGGAGIKLITDFYVFDKPLDMLVLNSYLRELKLDTLDGIVRRLVDFWFNMRQTADDSVRFVSEYIIKNGVYGNSETGVKLQFADIHSKGGKLAHYFKMTFRPYSTMAYMYPFLKKAPFLLPVCYFHRILKKLTWGRGRTAEVIRGSRENGDMHVLSEFKKIL